MEYTPPPFFKRGPSLLTRLSFFTALSLVLLYADARFHYMESMRKVVAVVVYPLQQLADLPGEVGSRVSSFFVTQSSLQRENDRLARENFLNSGLLQNQQALIAENLHLRALLEMQERVEQSSVSAEILYFGRDPFGRKIVIDKGAMQDIEEGAAVVDDTGLVGQVTRAFPWTAEIALITDREQVVPVQIVRNGLRAVVFGIGYDGALDLRFMPVNADIENGDVLVTSGIDGVYPAGLPVAVVSNIERNAAYPFAKITCTPTAGVNRHRQVLVLARLAPLPEYPVVPEAARAAKPRGKKKGGG
ncbi:MAG TPA: rod shape-determining protein MreC [Burkholderiales bacterium]|nr:rod shape-determining protein MreC [Burkholderiales bacterium]